MFAKLTSIFTFTKFFSGDLAFLLVLFVLFFIFVMYMGRGMIVSFILAYYPATSLYTTFPFLSKFLVLHGDNMVLLNKIGIFLLFLVPLVIIIDRYIFSASEYGGSNGVLKSAGLSIASVALVVLFSYNIVNYDLFHNFSTQIDQLFTFSGALFYWNLGPILLLAVF